MESRKKSLLQWMVRYFGKPDKSGYWSIYIEGAHRLAYLEGVRVYPESVMPHLYEAAKLDLISVSDGRMGFSFDGPYGISPGFCPGKPEDSVGIIIIDDEAYDWIFAT